jgi:hypothetical protein
MLDELKEKKKTYEHENRVFEKSVRKELRQPMRFMKYPLNE